MFRAFSLLLCLSLILAGWSFYTLQKISSKHELALLATRLQALIKEMRYNEKEFLLTEIRDETFYQSGKSKFNDSIQVEAQRIEQLIDHLTDHSFQQDTLFSHAIVELKNQSHLYVETFKNLVSKSLEKGYKNYGKVGELRTSIHQVEHMPYEYDKTGMLMLRRLEKDFLLRKDLQYLHQFDNTFESFRTELNDDLIAKLAHQDSISIIMEWVDNYRQHFHKVVQAEQEIGLSPQHGLLATLEQSAVASEAATKPIIELIQQKSRREQLLAKIMLGIVFALQLIVGGVLALLFSRKLSDRIKLLQERIQELAKGKIPAPLAENGRDELAMAGSSLNQLNEGLHRYAKFAQAIGQGDFDSHFAPLSEEDQLGDSLLSMRANLQNIQQQERTRSFILDGVASFTTLIRQQPDNLYDCIISKLTNSVKAVQGALFIRADNEEEQTVLRLAACYAWNRKKYVKQDLYPGEGLVGQTFLEKEKMLLTEIPQHYIQIKSGLGGRQPDCLLILPLMVEEQVCGVLELAAFHIFEDHEVELAEKIGEALAAAILNLQNQQEIEKLYQESHAHMETLKAQEEEMRQNNEELQATQEEMKRKETEYLQKIEALETELINQS
uniref:GAF domain-containing protein n=1 Tax=Roseihalotalea indica TaxID=2867963 RepID=A0AA49GKT1_9BACT|nr:GAF domain-containing protein [Tunicatimonas sp. TK19036]